MRTRHGAGVERAIELRIPMRGYESVPSPAPGVVSALRIPMRGYESSSVYQAALVGFVTNPHEGL